jgi:hypothetical protein
MLSESGEDLYKNGVSVALTNQPEEILAFPNVVGIPPSILKAPIFVLSDEVSRKFSQIIVKWKNGSFTFSRTGDNPFPTAVHAFYFLIILSKFACAWNPEGKVSFKFAELLRLGGKKPKSSNDPIIEMIWRYMNTHANWANSFGPRHIAWAGSLIRKCDLWDDDGKLVKRNPGRSKDEKHWHTLWLHEEIVEALRAGETRLYYSKIYKMGLNPSEIIIYNYFYSFGDQKGFWHSLYDSEQGLTKAFTWTSPKHKFLAWITKYLNSLLEKELIEPYKMNESSTAVWVKARSLSENQKKVELVSEHETPENLQNVDGRIVDAEHEYGTAVAQSLTDSGLKSRRKGASKKVPTMPIVNLTPEAIIVEYLARKKQNLIDKDQVEIIDMLLERKRQDHAVTIIKNHVLLG